jgi:hypothetical protein
MLFEAVLFAAKCMSLVVPLERQLAVAVIVVQQRFRIAASLVAVIVAIVIACVLSRRVVIPTDTRVVTLASGARVTLRNGLYRAN